MISLRECSVRRAFMEYQFKKYGVKKWNWYLTDRWEDIKHNLTVSSRYMTDNFGTVISHLNSLNVWYNSTNEEYAIFSDDDFSLETIDYWNFTWDEFIEALPEDWECMQLIRLDAFPYEKMIAYPHNYQLNTLQNRWWGSVYMMKREYVKKILDRHVIRYDTYRLELLDNYPEEMNEYNTEVIENIMLMHKGVLYNIPLFVFSLEDESTYSYRVSKAPDMHEIACRKIFLDLWKEHGPNLNVKDLTKIY